MRTKFDLTNAAAAVEEYVATLQDPKRIPTQTACRSWLEFCLERHGIIPSVRGLAFMESHALWYACLIVTGNVRRVSRLERRIMPAPGRGTTERTIRRLQSGDLRSVLAATLLREVLEAAGGKVGAG